MLSWKLSLLAFAVLNLTSLFNRADVVTFDFDDLPLPTITPFSDTNAGITATTFTTPDPARCFFLSSLNTAPGFFAGNILYDCHIGQSELDILRLVRTPAASICFSKLLGQ